MRSISHALRGGLCICVLLLGQPTWAQMGVLPRDLTQAGRALSDEQEAQIVVFIQHWLPGLTAEDDFKKIDQARQALGLRQAHSFPGGISPFFRRAYSDLLEPHLIPIIQGANRRAAIDALLIAARLGTDAGMKLLIERIDSEDPHLRSAAAGRAILAITDIQNNRSMVAPALVSNLARQVARMARSEPTGYAMQRQLELLNAIHLTADLDPDTFGLLASTVHKNQIAVLGAQGEDLQPGDVDAMTMLLGTLRSTFQVAPAAVQKDEGTVLAKHIRAILKAAYEDWDEAHQLRPVHESYARLIDDAERFLSFIDRSVAGTQTPDTKMNQYWRERDKPLYQRDLDRWNEHLSQPPYLLNLGG